MSTESEILKGLNIDQLQKPEIIDTDKLSSGTGDEKGSEISDETVVEQLDPPTPPVKKGEENTKENEKEIEILTDDAGNIVNEAGKILLKSSEFETDAEGNLVITDKVKNALNLSPENTPMIEVAKQALINDLGINLKDNTGVDLTFSDDGKGLVNLVNIAAAKLTEKNIQSFFAENEEEARYYKHLKSGGTKESYFKGNHFQDYSKLPDPKTDAEKKNLIKEAFMVANSMTAEKAEKMVNLLSDAGELDENIDFAKDSLKEYQKKYDAETQAKIASNEEARQKEIIDYWSKVKDVVDTGNLNGTIVPKAERATFFDYLSKPVKNGASQATIDANNSDVPQQVLIEYLRFKKFDLAEAVKRIAADEQANTLSARKTKVKLKMKNPNVGGTTVAGSSRQFPTTQELI